MHIILADDTVLLRDGIAAILERQGHRVTPAGDADELRAEVRRAFAEDDPPSLVITDVRMPPRSTTDGMQAAIELRREHPGLPVLVLSEFIAGAYLSALIADGTGGVGYLLKSRVGHVSDFLASIDVVCAGGTAIDPAVIQQLLPSHTASPLSELTPREREVLHAMAQGASNAQIARSLVVSEAAVAKHIGNIFAKLGLTEDEKGHRRVHAVLMYLTASHV